MSRNVWLWRITTWLLVCVFVLVPISSVFAQEELPGVEEPVLPKAQQGAVSDTADPAKQETSEIYLPMMQTRPTTDVGAAATNAIWRTVVFEGFEGLFPSGSWWVMDYDGNPASGIWDDTPTKYKTGGWSAHPTDGVRPYPNSMATIMRYGPFSLVGATNARLKFDYFLDSEAGYDFFKWGYSCNGLNNWTEKSVSGNSSWKAVTESIKSCKGKSNVYVQFTFTTDGSVTDQGVWVDNIRVEKYQ
jgi:hypothetical protein